MKILKYILFLIPYLLGGAFLLIIIVGCQSDNKKVADENFTRFVNPFIGTEGLGHTFPGATVPLGLVQLSPHTGNYEWKYTSGYQFSDSIIRGFSFTHVSGGGVPVLGDILMLPFSDDLEILNNEIPFIKSSEKAIPGYYAVMLLDDSIKVELTTSAHSGFQRYTFPKGGDGHVLINIDEVLLRRYNSNRQAVRDASFVIENDKSLSGHYKATVKNIERSVYFTLQFNRPFTGNHFIDAPRNRKLIVDFKLDPGDVIEVRGSVSTVNTDGAKKNLKAEGDGKSFEEIKKDAQKLWNSYLSRISIEGTQDQKIIFYTSLYHLFIQPNNIADVDGGYRGADDNVYTSPSGTFFSTFAFWDIYRAAYPLYTIIIPEKIDDFTSSILRHYDEKGYLPVWPLWGKDSYVMIGNHSVPVLVDAFLKGFKYFDPDKLFEAIKVTLTENHKNENWSAVKYDWSIYNKYGYLPSDKVNAEAVSRTLEATYDDWCAAQMAKALGKTEDYDFFKKRSTYYKNLYDSSTMFMRGKNSNGEWVTPFNPLNVGQDYTEANAWQYLWHVQHDVAGLIRLMGGSEMFEKKLDSLFSISSEIIGEGSINDVSGLIGQYAHGNEPSQHIAYLYNYVGRPHKTQEMVGRILRTKYSNTPDGLCGNDDFGQMSAWYVLSSMGLYPVNPASGEFDIGVPLHKSVSIKLEGGKSFTITVENLSSGNIYVRSVTLNGKSLENYKISYDDIMQGGELIFEMTDVPVLIEK